MKVLDVDLRQWNAIDKISWVAFAPSTGFSLVRGSKWYTTPWNKASPNYWTASASIPVSWITTKMSIEIAFDSTKISTWCPFMIWTEYVWWTYILWFLPTTAQWYPAIVVWWVVISNAPISIPRVKQSHIVVTVDSDTDKIQLYYNWVLISNPNFPNQAVDLTAMNRTLTCTINAQAETARPFSDSLYIARIHNTKLDSKEVWNLYKEFLQSQPLLEKKTNFYYPVWYPDAKKIKLKETFAYDKSDGTSIVPNGWIKWTWNYKLVTEPTWNAIVKKLQKYLQCTTDWTMATPSTQAYWTWEFNMTHWSDTTTTDTFFISNIINWFDTGWTWYILWFTKNTKRLILARLTNWVWTALCFTKASYIVSWVTYRIKITRTTDWVFTIYIKWGTFWNDYILVNMTWWSWTNPTTDTTYTTSSFFSINYDVLDRISDIVIKQGVEV